jgi:lipoteichoic acid synthase
VFETLLYTDDALRYFLGEYAKRADYGRTIFIITGDHRLIPVPELARIDRYRVPFVIFSPMLKAPRRFSSVSSHTDVTPSILALLHRNYGMSFPDPVPWLGTGIDTARGFRNAHSLAPMRVLNQMDDYLDGLDFLSGDQLFRVGEGLALQRSQDGTTLATLRAKLERARRLSRFVMGGDHIYPGSAADSAERSAVRAADSAFATLGLSGKNADELYTIARTRAMAGDYRTARTILGKLLSDSPTSRSARTLLGRTYSWNHEFDEARRILTDLVRRSPEYEDAHSALIDVELWSGRGDAALAAVSAALRRFPDSKDLLAQKARAVDLAARKEKQ